MRYLLEFKAYFQVDEIVYIEYWYNGMITPVKLLERRGNSWLVTHNNPYSTIYNAPDEVIKSVEIIDHYQIIDSK